MNGIMAWVKSHLLIVVSVVLIVVFLPAGFVGAGMWNSRIKKAADTTFKDEERKLAGQERVQYSLPSVLEGEAAIESPQAPNARVTEFYRQQRGAREHQVGRIVELATQLNRNEHTPLIDGLFPEASSPRARAELARELARRLAAPAGGVDAYDGLVRRLGGGEPPDPEDVAAALGDIEQREKEQRGVFGTADRLAPEQEKSLREEMASQRVRQYAARAGDLTFYVLPGLFDAKGGGPGGPGAPSALPTPDSAKGTPTERETFLWQWDYWVAQDVLRAVARANSDEAGLPVGVPDAPIKRVDSLTVSDVTFAVVSEDGVSSAGGAGLPPTYTGRLAESQTEYDVRMVRLEAVVAPSQLPRFFDALARTNYMTVTGLEIVRIDPWDDLAAGYYFGPEPVAHAVIEIETVWLRSWTSGFMPPTVREGLGIVTPGGEGEGEAAGEEETEP